MTHIDLAQAEHHASLADLLCELHAFYNGGVALPREQVHAHLTANLLAEHSPQRLIVACGDDGRVVGLAAITLLWSLVEAAPEKARQCHLKELFVRSASRGKGVGEALMSWVARYALAQGCQRIDWPVKASNASGIRFYEALGARQVGDRLSYRLEPPALGALAERDGPRRR